MTACLKQPHQYLYDSKLSDSEKSSSSGHSSIIIRRKPLPTKLTTGSNIEVHQPDPAIHNLSGNAQKINTRTHGRHFKYPGSKPAKSQPCRFIYNNIVDHNPFRKHGPPALDKTNTAVGNRHDKYGPEYKPHIDKNALSPIFRDASAAYQAGYHDAKSGPSGNLVELIKDESGRLEFRKPSRELHWHSNMQSVETIPKKVRFADEDRLTAWTDEEIVPVAPRSNHVKRVPASIPLVPVTLENKPIIERTDIHASDHSVPKTRYLPLSKLSSWAGLTAPDRLVAIHPHPNESIRPQSPESDRSSTASDYVRFAKAQDTKDYQEEKLQVETANHLAGNAKLEMERREEKKKARILAAAAAITERYKKRNEKLEQKLEKKMSVLSVPATNLEIKSPTTSEESKKKQEPEAEALPSDYLAVFALGVLLAITIVILWDLLSNLRNPFR